jgi:Fe-S cluster assembly iron-binding protein IscA
MKQYLTFTPDRAPENTFLGFAIPNENRFDEDDVHFDADKTQGVIWGKSSGYFTNKTVDYIKVRRNLNILGWIWM